ncbi:hypothetical protein KRP22_002177 [Phytophthora ramorum]|nr:hypothetical protein KRP22_1460 [Phytophthora ramorum]
MVFIERDFSDGKWPFGSEGDPNDVPVPTGAACAKISEILALADEHAGEYSFGDQGDMLPSNPGLCIDGLGVIALPLVQEQAEKLIEKCEMSPFGHNVETKTDERVRKSWQLHPDQVQFKNPQWENGITELSKLIANRLCYKDVPMECKLYKLLVYGEVCMKVVYRGGEELHRYALGKADGTAAFLPNYAVHYVDAGHSLETVTKGYRLGLEDEAIQQDLRKMATEANDLDFLHEVEANDETTSLLASLAEKRIVWLKEKIQQLDGPFSWEMPDVQFPTVGCHDIDDFLTGPGRSKATGRSSFTEARKFVTTNMRGSQTESSYTMEPVDDGRKALVKITKTRAWYDNSRVKKLAEYKVELERPTKLYRSPMKEARVE